MRNRIAALAASVLILTGCTAIDDGTAVPADGTMPTLPPLTETTTEETTTVTETETTTETTTEAVSETDISESESEAEESETTAAASMSSSEYKEHFSDSLFIGDSITVGFSAYGYIGENNVAAKVGLNPSSALTKEIEMPDGSVKTVSARAAELQPKNVYIMLGSNGIQWLSNESMLSSVSELSAEIKAADPDCSVYLLSIPPVTEVYNSENEGDIMSRINDYNAELKNIAAQNGCGYIDITTPLQDSSGYFMPELAEKDGIHFKGRCYTLVLDEIIKNS
ncbi:MAG: hypothetical protein J5999_09105 [Oscillospiraceae bacterium]|nr:hypothetical protein [Oscillospiraceae bacterium]